MSLKVACEGQRSKGFDDLHRVFEQRNAVARIETNANMVATEALQYAQQFLGSPVLVVLNSEPDSVPNDDRRG